MKAFYLPRLLVPEYPRGFQGGQGGDTERFQTGTAGLPHSRASCACTLAATLAREVPPAAQQDMKPPGQWYQHSWRDWPEVSASPLPSQVSPVGITGAPHHTVTYLSPPAPPARPFLPSLPQSVSCSDASVKSQPCYSLHLHKYLAVLTWDAVKHLYHLSPTPSLPSLCKTGTRLSSVTAECFCTTKYFWARNKQKNFSIIL